ncbi:MAG: hypothetical protein JWM08_3067 [Candidatus Angelobacter sp.]|jgi:hypothetical protein|nr:hypothetical protein [Candidatus Angelobacter sp.]
MSCCGRSRVQAAFNANRMPAPPVGTVAFEYIGMTRLTVIGPVTRKRYEFAGLGARVHVDRSDSNSLAVVPTLRRV